MNKSLIILVLILITIIMAMILSNLPFDVNPNMNVDYQQLYVQMRKTWY